MPGKAQQAKREQQAARVTAESKKKSMQKRETDSKQQRAKKDNHGFVLILYINATLFRYIFPPTVLLGSCFVLSWLKCNARLYYPLVHRTPCPIVESTRLLPGNTCREWVPWLASAHINGRDKKMLHCGISVHQNQNPNKNNFIYRLGIEGSNLLNLA